MSGKMSIIECETADTEDFENIRLLIASEIYRENLLHRSLRFKFNQ